MLLLAIDTSTTAITVAVHDGSRALAEATTLDARGHAEHLAPGITRVLAEAGAAPADLTDIACGLGPGPFTGLRVGIVTARTLALVTGARLHGLCSLDALAYQAGVEGELLVATDARRKEVYWATYAPGATGIPERLAGPHVAKPADLPADAATCRRWVAARCCTRGRSPVLSTARSTSRRPRWRTLSPDGSLRARRSTSTSRTTCAVRTPPRQCRPNRPSGERPA